MEPDDELCLCFHVSRRKVWNHIRRERPQKPSQLSECHGAGTGCGWCRPYLEKLLNAYLASDLNAVEPIPDSADYARQRSDYVRAGKGTPPPGATPIE
ncbi:MAG TPA: (2Fe-2S)-binding protein [Pirellulaceae bacterium]